MTASTRKANTTSRRCSAPSPTTISWSLAAPACCKPYRNKRTLELLWQGVWAYVREHGGGVDDRLRELSRAPTRVLHAEALSYLHHTALAPAEWRVRAHEHLRVDMNMLPKEAINTRAAIRALPPLIKGYLRVGAYVGDGAVIDHQFGTTDVFLVMPVEAMNTRIFDHFGAPDELATRRSSRTSPPSTR